MLGAFHDHVRQVLDEIRTAGLAKAERILSTPQGDRIGVDGRTGIINLCANNYLGLGNHPALVEAAHRALDRWGYGLSSVRFICGTQEIHRELERRLSRFLGTEDTILYSSCFDANGGLFETLLGAEDAIVSDQLNHASIIDGIRLCKAKTLRYRNGDMAELEARLAEAAGARFRLIATDGVFSMDGSIAELPAIAALAERHQALVMVDDSHAVGFLGAHGRGTHEHHGVMERIDIITGTLGKALGGASGGYISGRQEIIDLLRQRSRPYLFSNTLAPVIAAASIAALDLVESSTELRDRLMANTRLFRDGMAARGFRIPGTIHPICPVMLGDAQLATRMAQALLERGINVIGFSYPVVPRDQARIRVQVSAAHEPGDLAYAVEQFAAVRDQLAGA